MLCQNFFDLERSLEKVVALKSVAYPGDVRTHDCKEFSSTSNY